MNGNKTIKVLRIITLTFTMILLVFGLMKKVGLCAGSASYERGQIAGRCYYGISPFSDSDISNFISFMQIDNYGNVGSANDDYFIEIYSMDSDYYYVRFNFFSESTGYSFYSSHSNSSDSAVCFDDYQNGYTVSLNGYKRSVSYRVSKSDFSDILHWDTWYGGSYSFNYYLTSESYDPGIAVTTYPFYTTSNFLVNDGSGSNYYPFFMAAGFLPSAPGLVDFDALQDVVDATSDFSDDVGNLVSSLPTDNGSTSVGQWLSNIFSLVGGGFQGLFYNIYTFFKPYLEAFLDTFNTIIDIITSIPGILSDIYDTIESFKDTDITDTWTNGFRNSWIYSIYDDITVVDTAVKSVVNTQPANSVSFTISLPSWNIPRINGSGSVNAISNSNITVNFDWYTVSRFSNGDSIRDRVWSVFIPFLAFGFMVRLLFKLPGVLGGSSGLSDGFHKTVELSNAYSNRVKE